MAATLASLIGATGAAASAQTTATTAATSATAALFAAGRTTVAPATGTDNGSLSQAAADAKQPTAISKSERRAEFDQINADQRRVEFVHLGTSL